MKVTIRKGPLMGRDCWLVWNVGDEISIEGIFESRDDAMYHTTKMNKVTPGVFHMTYLEGGLYEQNTVP